MGKDSGLMAVIALIGIVYLASRPREENGDPLLGWGGGSGGNGIDYAFPEGDLGGVVEEELHVEAIRTGKLRVHSTVVDIPEVPQPDEIERARIRIKEIDKGIPAWVKARWGKAQQTPGWMPRGEV